MIFKKRKNMIEFGIKELVKSISLIIRGKNTVNIQNDHLGLLAGQHFRQHVVRLKNILKWFPACISGHPVLFPQLHRGKAALNVAVSNRDHIKAVLRFPIKAPCRGTFDVVVKYAAAPGEKKV